MAVSIANNFSRHPLREIRSVVQRVYDEKVSNQDQLNIGEAVVTLFGNILSEIIIHVTGNKLLQHNVFDVHFVRF